MRTISDVTVFRQKDKSWTAMRSLAHAQSYFISEAGLSNG